ncbi:Gm867 [Phodopus roborovskii]|uniref:Gm867 protein n=2 Tax=Phodopus roborovskii TaxID=109678 RepID=A0AAU9ZCK7_PHORO|nr:Gm867 [Phodopus roborovskii]
MFVTVMFGAGCQVLVNPWCSLVTFIRHLKQKAQVPPEVTIALLAEDGHLVKLEEGIAEPPSMAYSLLQEQGTYVLVQVIKGKDGTPTHYESLLDNLDDQCPELAEELCWLSGFPGTSNSQRRRTGIRRGHREHGPPSRSRRVASLPPRNR